MKSHEDETHKIVMARINLWLAERATAWAEVTASKRSPSYDDIFLKALKITPLSEQ